MLGYSKMVEKYAALEEDIFLIPDDIMEKDGVACGDYVTLLGERNEDIIEFKFKIDGCELCKASANYLFEKYSGKDINYILESLGKWLKEIKTDNNVLLKFFGVEELKGRFQCLYFPVEMLFAFVQKLANSSDIVLKQFDTSVKLECDACVVSSSVNWSGKEENVVEREAEKEYSTEFKEKWGKCSKTYLNDSEIALLKDLNENITEEDYAYLRKEKMSQMVYYNLLKNNIDTKRNAVWKDIIYRIHRKYIVQSEIEKVYDYISDENLKIYKVKGANSGDLYEGDGIRVHLDYDFVATSAKDAFKLANYLVKNDFMITRGVFSLKKIKVNNLDTYSGHFHLQKILNSQYRIVVDVNFPGFPMGRVDLFYPIVEDNKIIDEDQLLITLCHAYKHRNVYMKDINDIYI